MGEPLRPGDVVDGLYVVEQLLGQGGMGAVYAAREQRLARRVALKVLLTGVNDPAALARFEREALSSAALQSDHCARVFSVGRLASGAPYIVMELLEGEDLAELLARRGPLPSDEVVSFVMQICDALIEAHAIGIVHRDLKPANVFLARRPTGATTVKVLDFGISKGATVSPSPLTGTATMVGTPMYMSPEQLRRASAVDGRTDIWSLGAMMYELLTGAPPFQAVGLLDLVVLIDSAAPAPIARPDVPAALAAIVFRCLEKDPERRFASARDLITALAESASAPAAPRENEAKEILAPTTERMPKPAPADPRSPEARERAQVATVGVGATDEAAAAPPKPEPPRPAPSAHAATVDPVSTTAHAPPTATAALPALLAFAGALGLGVIGFYFLVLRTPTPDATTTASPPPSVTTSIAPSAQAPSVATSSAPSTEPAVEDAGAIPTPPVVSAIARASDAKPPALLPPPASSPSLPAPPIAATSAPRPTPSTTPRPHPGSLMPDSRN
ncbi:MAG: protein kinase [Labilithrix sp.]|nr:protein kinase [Labilithrix sp.]